MYRPMHLCALAALALTITCGPKAADHEPPTEPTSPEADAEAARPRETPPIGTEPSDVASSDAEATAVDEPAIELTADEALAQGRAALQQGAYVRARDLCEEAALDSPDDAATIECMLSAAVAIPDEELAVRIVDRRCTESALPECYTELASRFRAADNPVQALHVLRLALDLDEAHAPAQRARKAALADAEKKVAERAADVAGPDRAATAAIGAKAFAREISARARSASGVADLIHPTLGVAVIHNIPGHLLQLDRVTSWPNGDHDYSTYVDSEVLGRLRRAARLPTRTRVITDDIGCVSFADAVVRGNGTAFDAWSVQLGSEYWALPEELWLAPPDSAAEDYGCKTEIPTVADFEHLRRVALTITHRVVFSSLWLDFGRVDGTWYLLAIEMEDDFCG